MVSKDHLIEHKEIYQICLAYEMAEKGIKPLFFFSWTEILLHLSRGQQDTLRAIDLSKL